MKIEVIEHCFGQNVRINNESIIKDENSTSNVDLLQTSLLNELFDIKDKLDIYDWSVIANIIISRNSKYEFVENESSKDDCDQCGNYNFTDTYKKKSDE